MRKYTVVLLAVLLLFAAVGCAGRQNSASDTGEPANTTKQSENKTAFENETVILATTTSTKDTGLLDVLLPIFEKKSGITVKPIAVGTGEAIKMGERGDADALLVHARQLEDEFMAKGFGKARKDVMYNDFVLIGPKSDPAKVKGAADAARAFKMIADQRTIFVSRGDDSGTHKKELKTWGKAGIKPAGNWYISTGQGMAATIRIANEKLAYTLSDRGTFLVQEKNIDLVVLAEKSKDLLNPYGAIAVNPDKFPRVNYEGAMKFIEFLVSDEGQKIIGEFGEQEYGKPLFAPDAK